MEAVRKRRIKRSGKQLIVDLPESFTAEIVDLIIWPADDQEGAENYSAPDKLSTLREKIKSKMTSSDIDNQLALLCEEWQRDI